MIRTKGLKPSILLPVEQRGKANPQTFSSLFFFISTVTIARWQSIKKAEVWSVQLLAGLLSKSLTASQKLESLPPNTLGPYLAKAGSTYAKAGPC